MSKNSDSNLKIESKPLDLLTQIFNAKQQYDRLDYELDIAKENRKQAKNEIDRLFIELNEQVPRMHAEAKEKDLFQKGFESGPPLDLWKAPPKEGGPNDGA